MNNNELQAIRLGNQSNEWWTPASIFKPIRHTYELATGSKFPELDPASCEQANVTICARRYFTAADDGIKQKWQAKSVWLNPPYGKTANRSNADIWVAKFIDEFYSHHYEIGFALINAAFGYNWFDSLLDRLHSRGGNALISRGLIPFSLAGKPSGKAKIASCLIYLGNKPLPQEAFVESWRQLF